MDNNTTVLVMAAAIVVFLLMRIFLNRKAPTKVVLEKNRTRGDDHRRPLAFRVRVGVVPEGKEYSGRPAWPPDWTNSRRINPVVTFCASGARSAQAVKILKAAGFTDVVSAGGLSDIPRR